MQIGVFVSVFWRVNFLNNNVGEKVKVWYALGSRREIPPIAKKTVEFLS